MPRACRDGILVASAFCSLTNLIQSQLKEQLNEQGDDDEDEDDEDEDDDELLDEEDEG